MVPISSSRLKSKKGIVISQKNNGRLRFFEFEVNK